MNGFDLLYAIGEADDALVMEAQTARRKTRWIPYAAAAALVLAAGIGALLLHRAPDAPRYLLDTTSMPAVLSTPQTGVTIPAMELPEPAEGASADMIAFVMVDGNMYTQAESFYDDAAVRIEPLLGEKLGYAPGNIDCFSDEAEYERQFASSVEGDVYTVQGYDPDFRLCVRHEYTHDTGKTDVWLCFLERLNGVTLSTGADLFESRLHLRDQTAAIQTQSHTDWDWNRGAIQPADLAPEAWSAFLDALEAGPFISTWKPGGTFYPDHPSSSVYDTPNQIHLFLSMADGTTVELRLVEGGYVFYGPLGWYCVQMPGAAFDAVYDACGGTHITGW